MSKTPQNTLNLVAFIERGLNKGNLKGSYELNEAFLLKTAVNTLTTLVNDMSQRGNTVLANLSLDPVARCLGILEQGLRKSNLKGCYDLDESHDLKDIMTQLQNWFKDLQAEYDVIKGSTSIPNRMPKKPAQLPRVEDVVGELEADDA